MTIIKGPIKLSGGFNAAEFLREKLGKAKIKVPFEATGWKSTKNSDVVIGDKVEEVVKKKVTKTKIKKMRKSK